MFKLLLAFLISVSAQAASLGGAIPSVTVAATGVNTAQVSITPAMLTGTGTNGVFSLYIGQSMTAGSFYPFYKNGVAYSTPSNMKTYCFDVTASSATPGYSYQMVSSQTSFASGAGSIVSGTYQCGASANSNCQLVGPTASVAAVVPGVYTFGDGSHVTYPGVQANNSDRYNIHMDCIEN